MKTTPIEKSLQTIIDNGGSMRLNLFPFKKEDVENCKSVVLRLPRGKLSENTYDGDYLEDIFVNLRRYVEHGAFSHQKVSEWICVNGYSRKRGEPIHAFGFIFEDNNGCHIYTVINYKGSRLPKR